MHFRVVKRSGRKEMQLPEGVTQPRSTDRTLVKALARAFRWKRMLASGEYATVAELAEREGIAPSYMTRVLRLTLFTPDIVEAILDGRQGPEVTLVRLLEPFPLAWNDQRDAVGAGRCAMVLQSLRECCAALLSRHAAMRMVRWRVPGSQQGSGDMLDQLLPEAQE